MDPNANLALAYDDLDVRREADKACRRLAANAGLDLRVARDIDRQNVIDEYEIAIRLEGMPRGKRVAWLKGWRKGYGL